MRTPTGRSWIRAAVLLAVLVPCLADAAPTPPARAGINPGLGVVPPDVTRSSPAATWASFLDLAGQRSWGKAAHLLDLSEVSLDGQRQVGEQVAEQLAAVLDRLSARRDAVSDQTLEGLAAEGRATGSVTAQRFEREGVRGEVVLHRVEDAPAGEIAWLFTPQTVSRVPFWYRVLVKGEGARRSEPINPGLGPVPAEVRRGTPREALAGYLDACRGGRFELAAHYLDLGASPPNEQAAQGARLSRRLSLALLRIEWIDLDAVSNQPLGTPEAGVPDDEERVLSTTVHGRYVELRLGHRWDPDQGHVWLVSRQSVAAIDRLYAHFGFGWLGDHAPVVFFSVSFAGLQLWQWSALLAALGFGWIVSRWLGRLSVRLAGRFAARTAVTWDDALVRALDGPAGIVMWAVLLFAVSPLIGLAPEARRVAFTVFRLLAVSGVGWLLLRLVDTTAEHLRSASPENRVAVGFLPIFVRFAKALVLAVLALVVLDVAGINVVGVLAGLGLGGVAIAFAAQKTIENMFGAASIAADRPFQVGDFVTIGSDTGTVEDIGFRSTRLRTLARTLVTIPNGVVVAGRIESFSARDRIMYNPTIGLVYGTTAAQIRAIRDAIKRLVAEHPRVHQPDHRVRFRSFGESALNLEVLCWIATSSFDEYLEVAEELNLAIAEIVEREGSSFAFPTRTVFLQGTVGRA
ncbi:MAG TPA: mechanosensitive ion channel family protein [Thermoanaerobaculaceae bacterium]|nr:mechanosensitive ion channel family protein [Thermoanaerobaculaceae bacterium]HRS16486.1 mechanosensitive ion channel family protein [Thermoanaerobaculaceae bacterium]